MIHKPFHDESSNDWHQTQQFFRLAHQVLTLQYFVHSAATLSRVVEASFHALLHAF